MYLHHVGGADMTFEEFMKLPYDERAEAYKTLSDHDRFLVRISEPLKGRTVGYSDVTEEEKEKANKMFDEFIKKKKEKHS